MAVIKCSITILVLFAVLQGVVYSAELCAVCEYDEWYYDTNVDCLESPDTVSTEACDTRCYTYGYYDIFDNLRVKRGCDSTDQYNFEDSCQVVNDYYVCTCNDTDSCNTDDSGYNTCYQCDSEGDDNCYKNLGSVTPLPCFTGGQNCATLLKDYDSSFFTNDVIRYCTNDAVNEAGTCVDALIGEECTYVCNGDNCNDRDGSAHVFVAPIVLISSVLLSVLIG